MFQVTRLTIICFFCAHQCGCLLSHSNHVVVRQDEPLRRIVFESENARQIFESEAKRAIGDDCNTSSASLAVPFVIGLETTRSVAPNAIRNDVATRFDIDNDCHITDYEASLQKQ